MIELVRRDYHPRLLAVKGEGAEAEAKFVGGVDYYFYEIMAWGTNLENVKALIAGLQNKLGFRKELKVITLPANNVGFFGRLKWFVTGR